MAPNPSFWVNFFLVLSSFCHIVQCFFLPRLVLCVLRRYKGATYLGAFGKRDISTHSPSSSAWILTLLCQRAQGEQWCLCDVLPFFFLFWTWTEWSGRESCGRFREYLSSARFRALSDEQIIHRLHTLGNNGTLDNRHWSLPCHVYAHSIACLEDST